MRQSLENLIKACQQVSESEPVSEKEDRIHVSSAVSKVAGVYEWLRNSLEFKEEHLVRRAAIERLLRRMSLFGPEAMANGRMFLRELVRSGYFPNDAIPERKADEVSGVLAKYTACLGDVGAEDQRLTAFLIQLASVELEHLLVPKEKLIEEAFVEFVYEEFRQRILWEGRLGSPDHEMQLFIAIHRAVLRSDDPTIAWTLFLASEKKWREFGAEDAHAIVPKLAELSGAIEFQLQQPTAKYYMRAIRQFVPALTILHDMLMTRSTEFVVLAHDEKQFLNEAIKAASSRIKTVNIRLNRMAWRATVYVFLTKMLVAFAIELPIEAVYHAFRIVPFATNLVFPPVLMFIAAKSAYVPKEKNVAKIAETLKELLFPENLTEPFRELRVQPRHSWIQAVFFFTATVAFFAFVSWFITKNLISIGFSFLSIGVFFFFLSVVSFFAWRIRQPVRDLTAIAPQEDMVGTLVDLVAFPFLLVGRLLSDAFAKMNISLLFIDIIIEAPLKLVLGFIEEWLMFLREKKEEMLE